MAITERDIRKEQIGQAVWDLIRREGIDQVSVRNVATAAGMSVGSLRHYFPTQTELLAFSMRLVIDNIGMRIAPLTSIVDPRERSQKIIEQTLPLDAERRAESEVWLAFTGMAMVNPTLRDLRNESDDKMHLLCEAVVGQLAPGLSATVARNEINRLYAVIDGLLIHGVMRPEVMPAAAIRHTLSHHLDELAKDA